MKHRAAGLLLHPTSLPGRFGIGDLGPEADRFLDWAAAAGQSWWQILPLGPPDGTSPYSCLSAFAGNPLLISPQLLLEQGFLTTADLDEVPDFPLNHVAFEQVTAWKSDLLRRSWARFQHHAGDAARRGLLDFRRQAWTWLDDWSLFAALRRRHDRRGWWDWPPALKQRDPAALDDARDAEAEEINFHCYVQWLFFEQWWRVKGEAARRGIGILGDMPIYVSWNSAEVWAHPDLFELDDHGQPLAVAGAPPDNYCEEGQRWGNPLYRWDRMAEEGYAWWIARMKAALTTCDRLRLDHFRGFAGYWSVPNEAETAIDGGWKDGPGMAFFDALRGALGELPLIAEDLGVITPDVEELRRAAGLPGMKVLQFAFDDPESIHLPHHFEPASVVYTSTHDSNTTRGWYRDLESQTKQRIESYTGCEPNEIANAFIRLAYTSVAELAIVPVQDVLDLGSEARMNMPGTVEGNWLWRFEPSGLDPERAERLRLLAEVSGRKPTSGPTHGPENIR